MTVTVFVLNSLKVPEVIPCDHVNLLANRVEDDQSTDNREDMETAVRKLDDTEFKNPFDKTYIRVKYDRKGSRSRSRDSRSRS
eukprot:gene6459-8584_t